jgi:osmotically-inducible protein OsmY
MARDYERDRWGRRYDDEVERYDRDDRWRRIRDDEDYGRERGPVMYGRGRDYGRDDEYRRAAGARQSDLDYGYTGRGSAYDRERDYGREDEHRARGWRDREDDRPRYRDERDMSRYRDEREMNRYRDEREDDRRRLRRNAADADWVEQVPDHYRRRGPYEDYGWEAGESVLPEFRDPSVHRADYERRRPRRDDRSWWERARDEVSNWFSGINPEGDAAQDRRGGHRGRGPREYRRADERIREDLNDRLTDDDFLDASQIEVNVQNGEVILSGFVFNRTSKRRAEWLAEGVSGVANVENRLRVIPYGATAANNWDVRPNAGADQKTGATGEAETPGTSASATAGNSNRSS